MNRSDLVSVGWFLSCAAVMPIIVFLVLGIFDGSFALLTVIFLPITLFTTLVSASAFALILVVFRRFHSRLPERPLQVWPLALSASFVIFAVQIIVYSTASSPPNVYSSGDPAIWSRLVVLFFLGFLFLISASGLLVSWRHALSFLDIPVWLAWPILLLSIALPGVLFLSLAFIRIAIKSRWLANH
jgi:hypothetical protein